MRERPPYYWKKHSFFHRLDEYFTRIKLDTQTLPGNPLIQRFIKLDPDNTYELFQLKEQISREVYPYIAYRNKEFVGFYVHSDAGGKLVDLIDWSRGKPFKPDESFFVAGIQKVRGVPAILFYRNINDNVTYQSAGAMISAFDLDQILHIDDSVAWWENRHIAIADAKGRFVYHSDPDRWGTAAPSRWLSGMNAPYGYFIDKAGGETKIIVYRASEFTNLTMISEVSLNGLVGPWMERKSRNGRIIR